MWWLFSSDGHPLVCVDTMPAKAVQLFTKDYSNLYVTKRSLSDLTIDALRKRPGK